MQASGATNLSEDPSQHGVRGKDAAWYTAFFFLAEHFRKATNYTLNHKIVYSLVSTEGHYINHENPVIRKGAAGTLSRIIHSKDYAHNMRNAFILDSTACETAAIYMCSAVREAQGYDDAELRTWLVDECWPDVRRGLANEAVEWRRNLDALRLDCEMTMLLDYRDDEGSPIGAERVLSSMLHIMAFSHLEVATARMLVDAQPTRLPLPIADKRTCADSARTCLVRYADSMRAVLSGLWVLQEDEPFTIGRYTDCSAIERSPDVANLHCRIIWKDNAWLLECLAPDGGIEVYRRGVSIFPNRHDTNEAKGDTSKESEGVFALRFGDQIELPNGSVYSFSMLDRLSQLS